MYFLLFSACLFFDSKVFIFLLGFASSSIFTPLGRRCQFRNRKKSTYFQLLYYGWYEMFFLWLKANKARREQSNSTSRYAGTNVTKKKKQFPHDLTPLLHIKADPVNKLHTIYNCWQSSHLSCTSSTADYQTNVFRFGHNKNLYFFTFKYSIHFSPSL